MLFLYCKFEGSEKSSKFLFCILPLPWRICKAVILGSNQAGFFKTKIIIREELGTSQKALRWGSWDEFCKWKK